MSTKLGLFLLPVALALTTATQLRMHIFPLGPGETLLGVWLIFAAYGLRKERLSPFATECSMVFISYWLVSGIALALGSLFGASLDVWNPRAALHDALAYCLVMLLCLSLVLSPYSPAALRRLTRNVALAITLPIFVLWLYAQVTQGLGIVNFWYGLRYAGWAVNPNQAALLLLMAPFLAFHHIETSGGGMANNRQLGWSLLACAALTAGWSTDSGGLRLAWTVCIGLLAAGIMWRVKMGRTGAKGLLSALLLALLLAGMLHRAAETGPVRITQIEKVNLAIAADRQALNLPGAREVSGHVGGLEVGGQALNLPGAREVFDTQLPAITSVEQVYYQGDDELAVRATLAVNGLKAIFLSHLIGYGPGCYSGLERPLEGSEAHNTLVDWGTNAGVIGMVAMILLIVWLAHGLWRAGYFSLLAGLAALVVFSQFHHVLRHPIVWAYLALVGRLATEAMPLRSHFFRFAHAPSIAR
jgi:hypothetical protein